MPVGVRPATEKLLAGIQSLTRVLGARIFTLGGQFDW